MRPSGRALAVLGAGAACVVVAGLVAQAGVAGLAALIVAVGGLLLIRHPGVCLGLYAGLLVLFEQGPGVIPGAWLYETRGGGLSIAVVVLGLVVAAVAVDAARRRRPVALAPVLVIGVALLACAMAAGAVTAYSAGVGGTQIYDTVLVLLPLLVVPFAVHMTLDTPRRVRVALVIVVVLVTAKAAAGVVAVLGGLTAPDAGLGTDAGTRLTYYEPTVNWLCLALLLVGVAAGLRRVRLPGWMLVALPVVTLSLVLSYRRSFYIATVLGVLIVLLFGASRLQRRLALPAAALVALALWATFTLGGVTERLGGSVAERAESLSPAKVVANRQDRYRLDERSNVVRAIRAHPLTGLGIGVPWTAEVPLPLDNGNGRQYVHFALLWFWLKLGALGAVAYVALYGGAIVSGLRASRRRDDRLLAAVGLGLVGAFFALALAESTATFVGADARFSAVFAGVLGLVSRLATTPGRRAP